MAIAIVQSKFDAAVDNQTSDTLAFDSNVTAGNAIIVLNGGWNSGGFNVVDGGITDSLSNTYLTSARANTPGTPRALIFHAYNVTGGANTVTCTTAAAGSYWGWSIHEVSGLTTTDPADTSSTGSNSSGTAVSSGATATLAQADEIAFAVMATSTGQASITIEVTSPTWTQAWEQLDASLHEPGEGDYKVVAATTALTANWTLASSGAWSCAIATFKGAVVLPPPIVSYRALGAKNPTYVDRSRQLRGITIEYGGEK